MSKRGDAHEKGCDDYSKRQLAVREVIFKLNETAAWDHLQARDIDPNILDYVAERIVKKISPEQICRELGLRDSGGVNSKQFRKIMAYFNQGFRANTTAYCVQQLHEFYKVINKWKEQVDDSLENGYPMLVVSQIGPPEIVRVKGATKELGSVIESYGKAMQTPLKMLKEIGAIGEKTAAGGGGNQGITIMVQTNVPMPSAEQILANHAEMKAKAAAIEVKVRGPDGGES